MDYGKNLINKQIGITSNVITDRIGLNGYELIANAKFECVDFNMQRGFFNTTTNKYRENFFDNILIHEKKIKECGLKICQTHGPYYFSEEYIKTEKDLETYFYAVGQALEATKLLGCKKYVIHPLYCFKWMKNNTNYSNIKLTKIMIDELLNLSKGSDIIICIENLPYEFCNNINSHQEYIDYMDNDRVKGCFDSGHAFIHEKDPSKHLKLLKEKIYTVHLHDNDMIHDLHGRIDINKHIWKKVIKELLLNQKIDTISLETSGIYKSCKIEKIQQNLKYDYNSIKNLIEMIEV